MTRVPRLELNNGVSMPAVGLGVFQSSPKDTLTAVRTALDVGYRHIDTASAYGNEHEVGRAVRESGLNRDEVFLETKIWVEDYGTGTTRRAGEAATERLGVEQVDLLLLHQPTPALFRRTLEAYRDLESLLSDGVTRAIGVSNFQPNQLDALLAATDVVPTVNQVELHPYFQEPDVVVANDGAGILTQAWSPIGGITFYPGWDDRGISTLDDLTLAEVAANHRKTPAQVMLRWHIQEGRSAIPKSVNPVRIRENFALFDFELTADELAAIDGLDTGHRSGPNPEGPVITD